jgi:hypothetical protein
MRPNKLEGLPLETLSSQVLEIEGMDSVTSGLQEHFFSGPHFRHFGTSAASATATTSVSTDCLAPFKCKSLDSSVASTGGKKFSKTFFSLSVFVQQDMLS